MLILRSLAEYFDRRFTRLEHKIHGDFLRMANTFEELMQTIQSEAEQRANEVQAISVKLTEVQAALDELKAGQQGAIDAAVQQVLDEQSVKIGEAITAVEAIVPDEVVETPVEPAPVDTSVTPEPPAA
jgi:ElaB/YqjD/DUF883 family membrane-anchored ribosome-binding protein